MKRAQMACSSSISSGAASSPENGITSSLMARRRRRHPLAHRMKKDPSPSWRAPAATTTALTTKMLLISRGRAWKSTPTTRTRDGTGDGGAVRRRASSEGSSNTRGPGGGPSRRRCILTMIAYTQSSDPRLARRPRPAVRLVTRARQNGLEYQHHHKNGKSGESGKE